MARIVVVGAEGRRRRALQPVRLALAWLAALAVAPLAAIAVADDVLETSRAITVEFQKTLGGALKAALAEGGPVHAIDVCAEVAPDIAARISAEAGAAVSRTALRVRRSGNAPDAATSEVLETFRTRIAGGESGPMEFLGKNPNGGVRYLRAIVLEPVCVTCHGAELAPEVEAAVAARYPGDRATGFAPGELRGAFLVDWPGDGGSP